MSLRTSADHENRDQAAEIILAVNGLEDAETNLSILSHALGKKEDRDKCREALAKVREALALVR